MRSTSLVRPVARPPGGSPLDPLPTDPGSACNRKTSASCAALWHEEQTCAVEVYNDLSSWQVLQGGLAGNGRVLTQEVVIEGHAVRYSGCGKGKLTAYVFRKTPPEHPDRKEVAGSFPLWGRGSTPELTRGLREVRTRIAQQPLSSGSAPR